ncbi:LemA family protein [Mycoplasma corogypsi]|uniref:LemA family protein n=1 Tax=Mycoplasma corogypsi TaxID=2106 RepID=UPI003873B6EE
MANLYNQREVTDPQGFNPNVYNVPVNAKCGGFGKEIWYGSFIFIVPIFVHVSMRNALLREQNDINEAASLIDTQLQKRYDTLTKLVAQVKSYKEYEGSIMQEVTRLRSLIGQGSSTISNSREIESLNNSVFGRLMAISENYPELKASNAYEMLMRETTEIEREIAASRRLYNSKVNNFNQKLFIYPNSVAATSLGLSTAPLFAAAEEHKQDVKMDL